jgi:hypothetical protein
VKSGFPSAAHCRQKGTVEPPSEFDSAVNVFDLLVIFQIVTDDKAGSFALPFTTAHLLSTPSGNDATLVTVSKVDDNVGFCLRLQTSDIEVLDDVFIFRYLPRDVAQVLNRHFFVAAHQNHIVFYTEQGYRQSIIVR